ncbi:MAG: hypothetical protein WC735_00915 [Candidatus Paceibacterota bacterium]|jgi:hypothetical protein
MKEKIERKTVPSQEQLDEQKRIKMAEIIRAKRQQGLTLSAKEKLFFIEQQEENLRDDNP